MGHEKFTIQKASVHALLKFIFINIIAYILIAVIFDNSTANPSEGSYPIFNLSNQMTNELIIFIVSIIIGVAIGNIINSLSINVKIITSIISFPLTYFILLLTPIFIFLSKLDHGIILIYDGNTHRTFFDYFFVVRFMVYVIALYVTILIIRDFRQQELTSPHQVFRRSLIVVREKLTWIVNLMVFVTVALNLPFVYRNVVRDLFLLSFGGFLSEESLILSSVFTISLQLFVVEILLILIIQLVSPSSNNVMTDDFVIEQKEEKSHLISKITVIIFALIGIYSLLINGMLKNPASALSQTLLFGIRNPNYADFGVSNLPPSSEYLWGTDGFGRDIFAQTIFGFGLMFFVSYVAAYVKYIVSLRINKSFKDDKILIGGLFSVTKGVPTFLISMIMLMAFSYQLSLSSYNLTGFLIVIIIVGLLNIGSESQRINENSKLLSPFSNYILYETTSFMLLYVFLGYMGFTSAVLRYGNFADALFNLPMERWWPWVIPMVILVISLILLRISTIEPVNEDEMAMSSRR